MKERTEKQREAARRNGATSRGPLTSAGKARSSQNATRHGAYAAAVTVLPHESLTDWQALHDASVRRFQPADEQEYRIVAQLAGIQWRMQRNSMNETHMIEEAMYSRYVRGRARDIEAS